MLDLGKHDFARAEHLVAQRLGVLGEVDVLKGRILYPAALLCRRRGGEDHALALVEFALGERIVEGALDIEDIGRALVLQVQQNRLIDGNAQSALFVQGAHGAAQFLAHGDELLGALGKAGRILRLGERECVFHAPQHVRLVRLVGMQLQAEFADADAIKPLFDDVERRLFLGDEQHALAVREGVCDDIGDGLALARSGRAVQNKARSRRGKRDGGILRAVRGQRQEHGGGVRLVLLRRRRHIQPLHAVIEQCGDDLVLGERVDMAVQIVPHEVALEGECGEVDVAHDVPTLHARRLGAHHGEDLGDLQRPDVAAQPAHVDVEFLFEILQKGGVDEVAVVRRQADGKVLVAPAAHDGSGREHEGRIARDAVAADIAQKSKCKIEDLCARLLLRLAVAAHELVRRLHCVAVVVVGAQDALLLLEKDEFLPRPGQFHAEGDGVFRHRLALEAHFALLLQHGVQLVRARAVEVHGVLARKVEQRVLGGEV